MKINCLVKSCVEYEDRIDHITQAYVVDPSETVASLMDRLTGANHGNTRFHDSSTAVELRVAMAPPVHSEAGESE